MNQVSYDHRSYERNLNQLFNPVEVLTWCQIRSSIYETFHISLKIQYLNAYSLSEKGIILLLALFNLHQRSIC